jgi:preprotein translocase subunit SecF
LLFTTSGFAQAQDSTAIDQEFTKILDESNNYQEYKVVKEQKLRGLQKKVSTTISDLDSQLQKSKSKIKQQQKQMTAVQNDLKETRQNLNELKGSRDEINFLGMQLSKSSYQAITWGVVGVLILIIIFLVIKNKKNSADTKEAKIRLKQEQREFEDFREKSLEKQQKLGRKLQDEVNRSKKKNNNDI